MFLKLFNEVSTFVYDLLLTHLLAHPKVSEGCESKAPQLFPGVSISKQDPCGEKVQFMDEKILCLKYNLLDLYV